MTYLSRLCLFVLVASLAGCIPTKSEQKAEEPAASVEEYLLEKEPGAAKGVVEVREKSKNGDRITVVGRIGGSENPFTKGRYSFTLIDLGIEPCDDDGCGNPFCSVKPATLRKSTTLVKFVDENGKTLPGDTKAAFGVKDLSTVVVKGEARKDGEGNLVILASGMYVRK